MIEAFAHFYFGSNFAAQVLIVQVRETTFNYLLIGQTDLQKSVHSFQLKDGDDAVMAFSDTFLRGLGWRRLVSKPPYFCNELPPALDHSVKDSTDWWGSPWPEFFLLVFLWDSSEGSLCASNWIQAFQKVDSHFSNNSSFDEDDMIPLTLSVSPNDLFLPQLTNILLTRSCCHTPRSFYSKSCLLLLGWTVNRLFNCSMLQKQPLNILTNFLSEIGSSGVVSSLFKIVSMFQNILQALNGHHWKHSFIVHQTHQERQTDKNTTDSFCFNEFL